MTGLTLSAAVSDMMLWFIFAAMTAVAISALLRPMSRKQGVAHGHDKDVALYKDQLAEIDRDVSRGVLSAGDAQSARLEVARRLLAADALAKTEARQGDSADNAKWRKATSLGVIALIPAVAMGFYLSQGSPGLPDQPFQARMEVPASQLPVAALVVRVEQRLKEKPDDLRGWEVLAPSYVALRRYDDAVMAWMRAISLGGETAARLASLGEAQVFAANGIVVPAARQTLARAEGLDPLEPRAQYYLGLAEIEDGKKEAALKRWKALVARAPADARWKAGIETEIAGLEAAPAMPGPSAADVEAAGELSPQARQQMIETMVGRLAARLESSPDDLQGWLRLIRAYQVLGKTGEAKAASDKAKTIFAKDDAALAQLTQSLSAAP